MVLWGLLLAVFLGKGQEVLATFRKDRGFVKWRDLSFLVLMTAPILWAFLALAPWFSPSSKGVYAIHNFVVSESSVRFYSFVDQPHDCDFWTAPLGSKHCHYEPVIRLQSGVPHDRWSVSDALFPESRRTVTWSRVED